MQYVVSEPKTESSKRLVPCDQIVFDKIDALREAYKTMNRLERVHNIEYENFIFLSRNGKYQTPINFYTRVKNFGKKYHLPDITNHRFRHIYTTTLVRNGAVISSVARLLGHKNATMELKIYNDTMEEDKGQASNIENNYYNQLLLSKNMFDK